MIAELDHEVGRVLDAVETSTDADNTYVILAGDNGLAVGRHGLMGKQNLYDHSLRVPLIIRGPGVPRNQRTAALCHLMDVCPTVAGLAGVSMPTGLEARNLQPLFRRPSGKVRNFVVSAYRGVQRAIRTDRYKLIVYNVGGTKTTQIFDLVADPHELHNLASDAKHERRIAELTRLLRQELDAAGDPDARAWG
jgi:arylsulfatase A-like enzyme